MTVSQLINHLFVKALESNKQLTYKVYIFRPELVKMASYPSQKKGAGLVLKILNTLLSTLNYY
jgi:hypothetical protein